MPSDVRYHGEGFMLPQELRLHAGDKEEAEFVAHQTIRGTPKCRIWPWRWSLLLNQPKTESRRVLQHWLTPLEEIGVNHFRDNCEYRATH